MDKKSFKSRMIENFPPKDTQYHSASGLSTFFVNQNTGKSSAYGLQGALKQYMDIVITTSPTYGDNNGKSTGCGHGVSTVGSEAWEMSAREEFNRCLPIRYFDLSFRTNKSLQTNECDSVNVGTFCRLKLRLTSLLKLLLESCWEAKAINKDQP